MNALPMNGVPMNSGTGVDPLDELRDIHLPDAISWWPLAPGWWTLLALTFIVIVALFYYLRWRDVQKNKPVTFSTMQVMQAALLEFSSIEQNYNSKAEALSDDQTRQIVADISQLLRRCAVQITDLDNGPNAVAGLTGDAWLSWLDGRWDREDFMRGAGRILIDAPYRNAFSQSDALAELFSLCRTWLEQQT